MNAIPRPLLYVAGIILSILLVPPFVVGWIRETQSTGRPVHIFWDMDIQSKYKAQAVNDQFADGRAMRPMVAGAVARGEADLDPFLVEGVGPNGEWAVTLPKALGTSTDAMRDILARGQDRFNIYCTPCHGIAGYGDGMVNQRALDLMLNSEGPPDGTAWVQAKSLHDPTVRTLPVGQIYYTIKHGVRTMAGYASQIPTEDRWAIAAYVKALQLSQDAKLTDLPPSERGAVVAPPSNPSAPTPSR